MVHRERYRVDTHGTHSHERRDVNEEQGEKDIASVLCAPMRFALIVCFVPDNDFHRSDQANTAVCVCM